MSKKNLEGKFKNWLKKKAVIEMESPKKRLDQSLSWVFLYESFYNESVAKINPEKLREMMKY